MTHAERLLTDFRSEARRTRDVLEAVPEASFVWRPHEKSMSLAELAGHVAENPLWIGIILERDLDFADPAQAFVAFVPQSREQLLAAFDANVEEAGEALRDRDDTTLSQSWAMRMGPQVLFEAQRHDAVRDHAIHHWIHHRGQLTVYLRMLGVPVPSTYGPTADFPAMG